MTATQVPELPGMPAIDPLVGVLAELLEPLHAATPGPWRAEREVVLAAQPGSVADAAAVAAIPDAARRLTAAAWAAPACTDRGGQARLVRLTRMLAVAIPDPDWQIVHADDDEWGVVGIGSGIALGRPFAAEARPGAVPIVEAMDAESERVGPEHCATAALVALARTELCWLAWRVAAAITRVHDPETGDSAAYERLAAALIPVPDTAHLGRIDWEWTWSCLACRTSGDGDLVAARTAAAAHTCEVRTSR